MPKIKERCDINELSIEDFLKHYLGLADASFDNFRNLVLTTFDDVSLSNLKWQYINNPIKGFMLPLLLAIVAEQQSTELEKTFFWSRNLIFVDDRQMNCLAFLYYAQKLKQRKLFKGEVHVFHIKS